MSPYELVDSEKAAFPVGALCEAVGELVVDVVVHEEAVGRRAGCSAVAHLGEHGSLDCHVEIRVVEDNEGRVATELHGAVDDATRRLLQRKHVARLDDRRLAELRGLLDRVVALMETD